MNKIKPMIPEDPTKRKIYYIKLQMEKDEKSLKDIFLTDYTRKITKQRIADNQAKLKELEDAKT